VSGLAGPGIDPTHTIDNEEPEMNMKRIATALSFGAMLGIAAPVFADHIDSNFTSDVKKMMNKEGMISKKDFMEMASKRFDMMDKQKKGMISEADVMHIFGRSDKP